MKFRSYPWLTALILGVVALTSVRAQDEKPDAIELNKVKMKALLDKAEQEYQNFTKRPEKGYEFWAAMKFEMTLGKFDLAALHLKLMLEKEPKAEVDKDLVKVENAEGMSTFLRLREVKQWSDHKPFQEEAEKNLAELEKRVLGALKEYLSSPDRISKFIKNLDAPSVEERAFAFVQLERAREYAVPFMVDALRTSVGKPLFDKVRYHMLRMEASSVPVFLEVLKANDAKDAADTDVRLTLLEIVKQRNEIRAIPYLWHMMEAPMYPDIVRQKARTTLGSLLQEDPKTLPPARQALVQLAERYYQHRARFPVGGQVSLWPWDGLKLALEPVKLPYHQAEEFFGIRHAREALDLDPSYAPAQKIFLSLMLERAVESEMDQFLLKPMPSSVQNLLSRIDANLIAEVLERAIDEDKIAVILPTVAALGERGDIKAAGLTAGGQPRGLLRALYYPDRRVQFAAARAMLKMPEPPQPNVSLRVVDVMRRFVGSEDKPLALAAYVPTELKDGLRKSIKAVGYEPTLVRDQREAFEKLHASAEYDFIVLHQDLPLDLYPFVLTSLRRDADLGRLPIYVIAPTGREGAYRQAIARHRHVYLMPEVILTMEDELKKTIDEGIKLSQGQRFTTEERKETTKIALDILWRMARGELAGYDVRPATEALWANVRSPDLAVQALEVLGRVPGLETQQRLAALTLDRNQPKLRIPASIELNRHIQKNGVLLAKRQVEDLKTAYRNPAEDAGVKSQIAIVLGALHPSARLTGTQLYDYRPDPPAPPAEKKDEKKE